MLSIKERSGKAIRCIMLNINIFNIAKGIIDKRKTNDIEDDCVRQSSLYRFLNDSANSFNCDRKDFILIFIIQMILKIPPLQ